MDASVLEADGVLSRLLGLKADREAVVAQVYDVDSISRTRGSRHRPLDVTQVDAWRWKTKN